MERLRNNAAAVIVAAALLSVGWTRMASGAPDPDGPGNSEEQSADCGRDVSPAGEVAGSTAWCCPDADGLTVQTEPGGIRVVVDGQYEGITPFVLTGVQPGRHEIIPTDAFVPVSLKYQSSDGDFLEGKGGFIGPANVPRNSEVVVDYEPGGSDSVLITYRKPSLWTEWFAISLGGGYVANSTAYGKIDVSLFTLNFGNLYFTVIESNVFVGHGFVDLGWRFGYQHYLKRGWVFRAGLKQGFALWHETASGVFDHDWNVHIGIEFTPHVQFIKLYRHCSVGVGLDFPFLYDMFGEKHQGKWSSVAGGVQLYFRLSAF